MGNDLYAGARLRVLENAIIGEEKFERLLASDLNACIALLSEWGIKIEKNDKTGAFDREKTLLSRLSDAYREALESSENAEAVRLWLLPYDCNNIKSALKCRKRGKDPAPMLLDISGTIPSDTVKEAVLKNNLALLPECFASATAIASERFDRSGDPREVDAVLDGACYAEMLRVANDSGVALAVKLVQRKIDLTNVMIAIRGERMGDRAGILKNFFLTGGTLTGENLLAWSDAGEDALLDKLCYTKLEKFAKSAIDTDRTLAGLELASDNAFMDLAREAKMIPYGAEIPVGFIIGREYEVKNLRILLAGKSVGLPTASIRERMRLSYV